MEQPRVFDSVFGAEDVCVLTGGWVSRSNYQKVVNGDSCKGGTVIGVVEIKAWIILRQLELVFR